MGKVIHISSNDLIDVVPMFDIPDIMDRQTISDYRRLCDLLIIKRRLTLTRAKKLWRSLWYLKSFITVDVDPLIKAGKAPGESSLERYKAVQNDLNQRFEGLGISYSDFESLQISIPHPNAIDLDFKQLRGSYV